MIVCSCATICDKAIGEAVDAAERAGAEVTCGAVYRQLGKRPRCGNCRPLMAKIVAELATRGATCPATGSACAATQLSKGQCHEGRPEGHRVSQSRLAERADRREPVLAALPTA